MLTRKFVEGMELFARLWPGPVRAILHPSDDATGNLDPLVVHPRDTSFEVSLRRFGSAGFMEQLAGSDVVLAAPDHRHPSLANDCAAREIPCVYVLEYSLRTRLQIARAETPNPARRWRRMAWEVNQERLQLKSLRAIAGVQCNGTPTYESCRRIVPNAMLYFDSRATLEILATDDDLAARARRLRAGAPLTLAFSGRLAPMKGAEHLIEVASQLAHRGFPCRLLVAGEGPSAERMRARIGAEGLAGVQMLGVLDFRTELLPLLRREVDLFVACHPQGDPACTYVETFAAGVPVVGYANEAFAGLLRMADVGWGVPLGRPDGVADLIATLPRDEIVRRGAEALRFARAHTFELAFERRIAHLLELTRSARRPPLVAVA